MSPSTEPSRATRKRREGIVVSNRMQKTIVVRVDRLVQHGLYQRTLKRATSFKVHDEKNEARVGDRVRIMETRPLSKDKRWRLVEIVHRGAAPAAHELAQDPPQRMADPPISVAEPAVG